MVYNRLKSIQDWLLAGSCELCAAPLEGTGALCRQCEDSLTKPDSRCNICAAALPAGTYPHSCGHCQQEPPAFDSVHAALIYAQPVSGLIHDLKYNKKLYLARTLGELLAKSVANETSIGPDILFPVPLHRARLRQRGYNQSLEIAKPVSQHLGIAIDFNLVSRIKNTEPQTNLKPKHRAGNVKHAFKPMRSVEGKRIALIDDVMTTGFTVNAIAKILKVAGAKEVQVWVVARA
ncbi:MAG: ComF family protein [Acidiferrobacterales bacterium]